MKRLIPLLLAVLLLTGCGSLDVTRLLEHETPTRYPDPAPAPQVRMAPAIGGPAVRLRIYRGDVAVGDVLDAGMANQLFLAAQDDSYLLTDTASCPFTRKVELLDEKDTVLTQLMVAEDGCPYATRADGRVMVVPSYAYYGMECALWTKGDSLGSRTLTYHADTDSDAVLQMQMEREIPALLRQRYGYADGYFAQWELLEVIREKSTVTVSCLVRYGLYALTDTGFSPVRQGETALRLTYDWVDDDIWQLGVARFADEGETDATVKSAVRSIFTFEATQSYMQRRKDTDALKADILLQAKEYLRKRGLGRVEVEK